MSIRTNPFVEIERLFERLGRQFEEASRSWEAGDPTGLWLSRADSMPVDLVDRVDEFVVTVDAPGFDREEIELRATEQSLRITARHEESLEEDDEAYVRRERRERVLRRSVEVPEPIDPEGVTAGLNNGVLTVTLPKAEVEGARRVEID